MEIQKPIVTGTLESSDVQVVAELFAGGTQLSIESNVISQYDRQIKTTVLETLEHLGIKSGKVTVNDRGALECTLRAHVGCAVFHSCGASEKDTP